MNTPLVLPRYATTRTPGSLTLGGKAAKVAAQLGKPLMPWQRLVADTALELNEYGAYRYPLVVVTVPRQSGKTTLACPVATHRMLTVPRGRAWIGAQERGTADDIWAEYADLIEASPLQRIARRRDTNGQQRLTIGPSKSTLRPFTATSHKALHSQQSDVVLIDEGWAFTPEQGQALIQAVVPTQATRPGAQTWIVSTAGTAASVWLWEYVKRGRAGDPSMAYFEWSIPETTADFTDLSVYAAHHPALGHTITPAALEQAWTQMKHNPAEFARAYGNFWTGNAEFVIDPVLWESARAFDDGITPGGELALAVEVRSDRSGVVIAACGRDGHGRAVMEIVDERDGIGWAAPRVLELVERHRVRAVVIDPVSPASVVRTELLRQRRRRVPLLEDFTAGHLVDAQTALMDGLVAGTVRHWANEDDLFDIALRAATVRNLRETTVFSRAMAPDGTSPAAQPQRVIRITARVFDMSFPLALRPRRALALAAAASEITQRAEDAEAERAVLAERLALERDRDWGTAYDLLTGPFSRRQALKVPALRRGVRTITTAISQMPLKRWRDFTELESGPLLRQPERDRAYSVTVGRTVEDLIFHPHAWWLVTERDRYRWPVKVVRLEPEYVSVQTRFGTDEILHTFATYKGKVVPEQDLIRFDGPDQGVLELGEIEIATALRLEITARVCATPEIPSGYLKNVSQYDLDHDEARALLDEWTLARRVRSVAYLNANIEYHDTFADPERLQLVQAREESAAQIARLLNLPARYVSTKSGDSMTYSNIAAERRELLDLTLATYINAIQERLGMWDRNGSPRGHTVRFDPYPFLRSDPRQDAEIGEILIRSHQSTPDEQRAWRGQAPLPADAQQPPAPPDDEHGKDDDHPDDDQDKDGGTR